MTSIQLHASGTAFVATHIVGSLLNSLTNLGVQAVANVDDGSGLLQHAEGLDQRRGKAFRRATNVEVLQRPTGQRILTYTKPKILEYTVGSAHPSNGRLELASHRRCRARHGTSAPARL